MKLALKLGIQTFQILSNDDEVCIPSLFIIILAVRCVVGYHLYTTDTFGLSCNLKKLEVHENLYFLNIIFAYFMTELNATQK